MISESGQVINVGDILKSGYDYYVLVCEDKDGHLYGSLLCAITDSCRNIPYALNDGKRYWHTGIRINRDQAKDYR